jgi:ATP-binding cassette subfamily C protein LapB
MSGVNDLVDKLRGAASAMAAPSSASSHDPLAQALVDLAAHFGTHTSIDALRACVPLQDGRVTIEHALTLGDRVGFDLERRQIAPAEADAQPAPFVTIARDRTIEIVWAISESDAGERVALISAPGEISARVTVPFADLVNVWDGSILAVTPRVARGTTATVVAGPKSNWLWPAFDINRGLYAEALAGTVAINILALALPLFTMNIYDRVIPNAAQETLWALAVGVLLAIAFDVAIKLLRGHLVDRAGQRADVFLSREIFAKLLGAQLGAKHQSVGVRANTLREYETLREFLTSASLTTLGDLPFIVLFLVMIWVVAGSLVLVPIIAIPLVLGLGWLTQRALEKLTAQQFDQTAQRNAVAVETLVGIESMKVAGAESWAARQWEHAVAQSIRTGQKIRDVNAIGLNAVHAAQTAIQIVMIIVGFYMVVAGQLTTGAIIAATMLAGRVMQPLAGLALMLARLNQTRIAYRLLTEIIEAPQERDAADGQLTAVPLEGAVMFEGVTHRYHPDAPPVLDGVSFAIAPGERVAIVGAIGTGKTTILKLIHALQRPSQGRVLIDGIPGHLIDPAVLRRQISFAMHGAEIFQGTLRSNVTLGAPDAREADVLRALDAACAMSWILRLPKGIDTPVEERGRGLSSGQRQSLLLARALIGDPKVVMLDEPTSDMDQATEAAIVERLQTALAKKTMLIVSHRPALLALVDRLIVIENGKVLLDGPRAAVLASLKARMDAPRLSATTKSAVVIGAPVKSGGTS